MARCRELGTLFWTVGILLHTLFGGNKKLFGGIFGCINFLIKTIKIIHSIGK